MVDRVGVVEQEVGRCVAAKGVERKRIGQREDRRGTVVQRVVGGGEEAGGDASTVVRRDRGKDVGLGYAARCWVMVHVVGMLSCLCATCAENAMRGERRLEKWPQTSSRKPLTATAHIQTRHRIAPGRICRNRTHSGQKRVRRTSTAYQVWYRPVACASLCYICSPTHSSNWRRFVLLWQRHIKSCHMTSEDAKRTHHVM